MTACLAVSWAQTLLMMWRLELGRSEIVLWRPGLHSCSLATSLPQADQPPLLTCAEVTSLSHMLVRIGVTC